MQLPTNIQDIILDMLTIKKCNNKISNEFCVCIKIDSKINIDPKINIENIKEEVRQWFDSKISRFNNSLSNCIYIYDYHAPDPPDYDDYDSDEINDEDEFIGNEFNFSGEFNFLVHFHINPNDPELDRESLIIINEPPVIPKISPNSILELFLEEPEYVIGIGVSGLSIKYMKDYWWHMIGRREGYGKYPSYNLLGMNGEDSSNFEWRNYPHEK